MENESLDNYIIEEPIAYQEPVLHIYLVLPLMASYVCIFEEDTSLMAQRLYGTYEISSRSIRHKSYMQAYSSPRE